MLCNLFVHFWNKGGRSILILSIIYDCRFVIMEVVDSINHNLLFYYAIICTHLANNAMIWTLSSQSNHKSLVCWFNIEMPSYQYRKSHCGGKTILRPSYLHNGISYIGKMAFLYWIRALVSNLLRMCEPTIVCLLTWQLFEKQRFHGPLTRYVNLRVVHAPGMPGTFSSPPTSKETTT